MPSSSPLQVFNDYLAFPGCFQGEIFLFGHTCYDSQQGVGCRSLDVLEGKNGTFHPQKAAKGLPSVLSNNMVSLACQERRIYLHNLLALSQYSFFFKKRSFIECNLHAIHSVLLKCTVQWSLINLQKCTAITIQFRIFPDPRNIPCAHLFSPQYVSPLN